MTPAEREQLIAEITAHDLKFCTLISKMGGVTTPREISRHVWMCRRAAVAKAALKGLVERGRGQWAEGKSGPKGGRPTLRFVLNASTIEQCRNAVSTKPTGQHSNEHAAAENE